MNDSRRFQNTLIQPFAIQNLATLTNFTFNGFDEF